jgi:beta-lactamase regulating signal transducer with metallopeptidase domain
MFNRGGNMDYYFVILAMLWSMTLTTRAGWFNNGEQQERERRQHADQQLDMAEKKNDGLGIAVMVLSVAGLGIGAAVGSKTRRDAHQ